MTLYSLQNCCLNKVQDIHIFQQLFRVVLYSCYYKELKLLEVCKILKVVNNNVPLKIVNSFTSYIVSLL